MATNNCGKKLFLSLILRPLELPDTSHYCHFGADNYQQSIDQRISPQYNLRLFIGFFKYLDYLGVTEIDRMPLLRF